MMTFAMVVDTLRGFSFGQVAFIIGQLAKIPRRLAGELAVDVGELIKSNRWQVNRKSQQVDQ